jgi:aconitate hydratase
MLFIIRFWMLPRFIREGVTEIILQWLFIPAGGSVTEARMSASKAMDFASFYACFASRVKNARERVGRPLTYAEKILHAHLSPMSAGETMDAGARLPERRKSYVALYPDRVAMQDATAQMALLQFMHAGRSGVAVPTTVHCDHLIQAREGAGKDLLKAFDVNAEVYDFLRTVSAKYGIGFWKAGAGIIHQVVLENYAAPGGMMIGTDSHTPNAGGLGMVAVGVGGADAVDVMAGAPFDVRWPGLIGVELTGKLSGWSSPKDVILKLMGLLTTKGGTGCIVEFFGPGAASLSCTGKATVTNMGAEHGATTSVFPFDERMAQYLRATERSDLAAMCEEYAADLCADPEIASDPETYFDRVERIDLSILEPHVVGPHTPDLTRPISAFAAEAKAKDYPETFSYGLIGSCTNSSYEDMGRAAHVAKQVSDHGVKLVTPLMVTPGSDQIQATIERDGQMAVLTAVGATVLANACGPCIGQWKRDDIEMGDRNAILTSYNRNFKRRNDGNPETLGFISSPELVIAMAASGRLDFNPLTDEIADGQGGHFKLEPPSADELPAKGFVAGLEGYIPPPDVSVDVEVHVAAGSERLELLDRFAPWEGTDLDGLRVLLKATGKTTTDHISPAGPWLKYRGHLDNISDNMYVGVVNAFTDTPGTANNLVTGEQASVPAVARAYKAAGQGWVVFGDENYGEGSSREHAAMSPRFLGARAIVVRSFARIAEANLKKQGVLALTFGNPADYDKVEQDDQVSILGLADLAPGSSVTVRLQHADGKSDDIETKHTLSANQIDWFKAGSALNAMASGAN